MSKSRIVTAVVAAVSAAVLSACGIVGASDKGEALRVGLPYPQTGSYAEQGEDWADGARLAAQLVNEKGGVKIDGHRIDVEVSDCDTEIDPTQAATCGRRLATQEQTVAQLVITSAETFPIIAFNQSPRFPFLTVSSSAVPSLVTQGNELVARYGFAAEVYMPEFTRRLADALGATPDVAIVTVDDEYGDAWYEGFKEGWEQVGGQVVGGHATYAVGATDLYPQLTSVLKQDPDYVAAIGTCAQAAPVLKQARELGFKGGFIVYSSCSPDELSDSVGQEALKGSVFEGTRWNIETPKLAEFKAAFEAEYERPATFGAASGYSMMMWTIAAADEADSADDPAAIRDAMGAALEHGTAWNLLGASDFQEHNGEISTVVYPRIFHGPEDIDEYPPSGQGWN